jgi:hypothetical protein
MTSATKLRELASIEEQARRRSTSAMGILGEAVKTAVDKNNLNPRAFKKAVARFRGDPDKQWIDKQDEDYYLVALRFGSERTGDIFEDDEVDRIRGRRPGAENVVSLSEAGVAGDEREQVEGAA